MLTLHTPTSQQSNCLSFMIYSTVQPTNTWF